MLFDILKQQKSFNLIVKSKTFAFLNFFLAQKGNYFFKRQKQDKGVVFLYLNVDPFKMLLNQVIDFYSI